MQATHPSTVMTPGGHDAHHEPGFWLNTSFHHHRSLGIQYGLTALCVLLFGFCLMICMRGQSRIRQGISQCRPFFVETVLKNENGSSPAAQASLRRPLHIVGRDAWHDHGPSLAIVPLAFGAFRQLCRPASNRRAAAPPTWRFPRVNMASLPFLFHRRCGDVLPALHPWRRGPGGVYSYSPLGQHDCHAGSVSGSSAWCCSSVRHSWARSTLSRRSSSSRAPGMTWMRLPFFVWRQFVTAFSLLLAFPPLEARAWMHLVDNLFGSSFFPPTCLPWAAVRGCDWRWQPGALATLVSGPRPS